jgi:uncharacterized protein YjbI with pentapeptide repeats
LSPPSYSPEQLKKIFAYLHAGKKNLPPDKRDFRGADLRDMDLSGLNLNGVNFAGANLAGADLSGSHLFKANLSKAYLKRANLNNADLTAADLRYSVMENITAQKAGFGMTLLDGAKLFEANLEGATLTKTSMKSADLRCANLCGARIREASLKGADCTGTNFRACDLAKSDLTNAIFNDADLRQSRLRLVRGFEKAQWIGVDIRDINFAGAYQMRRFVIDQNYIKEFRKTSKLTAIIYYIWLITSDCGRSLLLWCCWIAAMTVLFAWVYLQIGVEYSGGKSFLAALYYSVVTLSTLGYGDILPITPAARIAAMVEVMGGYLMLGGLLSIFTNKMARRGD